MKKPSQPLNKMNEYCVEEFCMAEELESRLPPYDLLPVDFLLAIMQDNSVPVEHRIHAAEILLPIQLQGLLEDAPSQAV